MDPPPQRANLKRKGTKLSMGTLMDKLHIKPGANAPVGSSKGASTSTDRPLSRYWSRNGRSTPSDTFSRHQSLVNSDETPPTSIPSIRSLPPPTEKALPFAPPEVQTPQSLPFGSVEVPTAPPPEAVSQPSPPSPDEDSVAKGYHSDELRAPGQFPIGHDASNGPQHESWLSFFTHHVPALSGWSWEGDHVDSNMRHHFRRHYGDGHGSASEGMNTDTEFPFIESEVELDSPGDDEANGAAREDYFSYPAHRVNKKKNWHGGTPLAHPFSRAYNRRGKQRPRDGSDRDTLSRHDTWNLISASESPIASAANGEPELHPSAPHSQSLSKTLQELDEVEIKTFLQNFSRHTREVRLLGSTQHFSRMPQWDDFAYSSDEDDENTEEDPEQAALAQLDPHKRSKLLMHIDRGLQQLQPSGAPPEPTSACTTPGERHNRLTGHCIMEPNPDKSLKRSNSAGEILDKHDENQVEMDGPLQGIVEDLLNKPEITTTVRSPPDDSDQYESAPNSSAETPIRKQARVSTHTTKIPPKEDHVDGVAFCIAYILAFIERYAPNDLDDAPVTKYSETRARSHVERLYIIAPFWEQLLTYLRRMYSWEDPTRTAAAAMIYFVLWYTDLLFTAFFLMLIYHVLQFRFLPPDESYLHQRVQERMHRGMDANRLAERLKRSSRLDILDIYKRWQNTYGVASQVATGDVADFHEKIKNILLWRNPATSKRTVVLLSLSAAFVTFCSAHTVVKTVLFAIGFSFFGLMPLQEHYPRYRRPLNPLWWLVLGSPTDAQYAVQLLRQRHLNYQEWLQHNANDPSAAGAPPQPVPDGFTNLDSSQTHAVRRDESELKTPTATQTPMSKKRLGSFLCQHHGVPGHLIVTTTHLYFSPVHVVGSSGKHYVTRFDDVVGLRKTNSLRLFLWSSNGMKISRRNKNSLHLANMSHRDDAFNLLLALGSEVWRKV